VVWAKIGGSQHETLNCSPGRTGAFFLLASPEPVGHDRFHDFVGMLDRAAPGAYVRRDGRECPAPMHRPSGAICIAGVCNPLILITPRPNSVDCEPWHENGAGPTRARRPFASRLN
jgi:hypothetical protein